MLGGAYRRLSGEVRTDIQIHQTVVEFVLRRLKIPAQADVETQATLYAPIIVHEPIHPGGAEIFVGVSICYGAGGGQAFQEIGEIVSGEGAIKKKAAAWILLRQLIEVQPAEIAAESEVVIAMHPDQVLADLVGVVMIQ